MLSRATYLDYNATAPLLAAAKDSMLAIYAHPANASSVHKFGRTGRMHVESARDAVAKLVGTRANAVIFTSGATEANNTILRTAPVTRVLVGATEHPSILNGGGPAQEMIPVLPSGLIDLAALETLLANGNGDTALVSVMLVNNETGVIQPIRDIAQIVRACGGFLHCDAVQAAGRIAIDMKADGIDFLSLSAHKIGGPQGVGALVTHTCFDTQTMPPLLTGGAQEQNRRAGTENVAGIAGFGTAAAQAHAQLADFIKVGALRDRIEAHVMAACPQAIIFGKDAPRVANTTMIAMPGVPAETQMIHFDLAGIAVSNGSACASGTVKAPHVLKAMGADDTAATCAIRISLGHENTDADVDYFLETWDKLYERVKARIIA